MKIAPSILATPRWLYLKEEIDLLDSLPIDYIHLDVMDGHFVPNMSFGYDAVKAICETAKTPIYMHLMISCLETMLPRFVALKPKKIHFHHDADLSNTAKYIEMIKKNNIDVGLVLNPDTPVRAIAEYIPLIDDVLIMTVHPGFSGQKFLSAPLEKLSELKNVETWVDGGINLENAYFAHKADGVVTGKSFYDAVDKIEFIKTILKY